MKHIHTVPYRRGSGSWAVFKSLIELSRMGITEVAIERVVQLSLREAQADGYRNRKITEADVKKVARCLTRRCTTVEGLREIRPSLVPFRAVVELTVSETVLRITPQLRDMFYAEYDSTPRLVSSYSEQVRAGPRLSGRIRGSSKKSGDQRPPAVQRADDVLTRMINRAKAGQEVDVDAFEAAVDAVIATRITAGLRNAWPVMGWPEDVVKHCEQKMSERCIEQGVARA